MRQWFLVLSAAVFCWAAAEVDADTAPLPPPSEATVEFTRDIQPILRERCYSCHGPETQEGGLRLDVKDRALQGGDGGRAIRPGKSADSRLIGMVAGNDEDVGIMPPEGEGTPLSQEQVSLLRAWIDQGVSWSEDAQGQRPESSHWSFRPVELPPVPVVESGDWVRNSIDAFVLQRLESEGLAPSPEADRATLIRRLYLDLLGLPPSPEQVSAFLNDTRSDAYQRLVDRILESEHYGERWARHWLDLARYADSDGYEKDRPRPFAWRYRQWVIEALNADMPFDQFSIEQIAGDLLPEATVSQRVASGFHRNTLHNTEGGIDPEEDRVKKTVDRTNTVGAIWLGLSIGCAQCHSHKYDPITQREYYSTYAFFNSIQETDIPAPLPDELQRFNQQRAAFDKEHAALEAAVAAYEKDGDDHRTIDPRLAELQQAVTDHAGKAPKQPGTKARAVAEMASPRETRVHLRGDFLNKGDAVAIGVPAALPQVRARGEHPDRLDFARWLFDPTNPLIARVTVNRIWQRYFGQGIVATIDDFGTQGDRPTHPELLDWLACQLRDNGWKLKQLHRLIVSSSTYRQSSAHRPDLVDVDPENQLLARQNRRRVEAEIIRDAALASSGLLDPRVGGPSVRPPQSEEYSKLTYANSARWETSKGGDRYRRGLYTFFQRTSPYPMLMTFDSPDSTLCTAQRSTSNTPLQALTLMNDVVFFECAQALGRRIIEEAPTGQTAEETDANRAAYSVRLCLAREPGADELDTLIDLYRSQRELIEQTESAADAIIVAQAVPEDTTRAEFAAWMLVGRTLMNLDEFVTKE